MGVRPSPNYLVESHNNELCITQVYLCRLCRSHDPLEGAGPARFNESLGV
jgi:hypothetical protein